MLLLIAVLAVLSAAFLFWTAYRRDRRAISSAPTKILDATNLRPLFAPSQRELQNAARASEAEMIARQEDASRAEVQTRIDVALNKWRTSYGASSAATLLAVTAESGNAQDFSHAAEGIIEYYRDTGFMLVSAHDVADLIDSHRMLLPISERGSGTLFWLKEEVAKLRSLPSGPSRSKN